ncbi:hypothetical protein C8R46DRAFT_1081690 [Mycena filopes]|nr:hypothetical protein C8R46DRAFT_1081690 [Mycena filopes]
MVNLPGELVDSILDHLKEDKPTLLVCALVSRSWVPRSRRYRFSSIHLDLDFSRTQKLHKLLRLLSSPLATFAPCITAVHLSDPRDKPQK